MAEHDRERQLSELQKREGSRRVPPAVQELEIAAEAPEAPEEQSTEAAPTESSFSDVGDVSAEASVGPQPDSSTNSSDPGPSAQGDQAAAASTTSAAE